MAQNGILKRVVDTNDTGRDSDNLRTKLALGAGTAAMTIGALGSFLGDWVIPALGHLRTFLTSLASLGVVALLATGCGAMTDFLNEDQTVGFSMGVELPGMAPKVIRGTFSVEGLGDPELDDAD